MRQKKRKQHYVWEHYLSAWADRGQIWCLRGNRTFRTNTDNVANRRDFYRIREMSARDFEVVNALVIEPTVAHLRGIAMGWIPMFHQVYEFKRLYEAGGVKNEEAEQLLDVTINNLEEDLHAHIEQQAIPILANLRRQETSFLDGDEAVVYFFWFIAVQHMRTQKMMRTALRTMPVIPGFNLEASWGLIRTILAANLGAGLHRGRDVMRLTFLSTPAQAEFLTADQPTVNVRAAGLPEGEAPTELELYYPLTPTQALLVDFDGRARQVVRRDLKASEVRGYNRLIAASADEQIYASSEDTLTSCASTK